MCICVYVYVCVRERETIKSVTAAVHVTHAVHVLSYFSPFCSASLSFSVFYLLAPARAPLPSIINSISFLFPLHSSQEITQSKISFVINYAVLMITFGFLN